MRYDLVTFDAYAALVDYRSSLLPVVESIPGLDAQHASAFLDLWRARQLGVAALSNALDLQRIPFRQCTALALDYALARHQLAVDAGTRESLVEAWNTLEPTKVTPRMAAKSALRRSSITIAILA